MDFIGVGGNENDRRQGGLFALANVSGRLVAVHVRHVDVEEDHREVMLQDELQRVGARPGCHHVFVELFQDRAQNQEVLGKIVHDQYVDFIRGGHLHSVLRFDLSNRRWRR